MSRRICWDTMLFIHFFEDNGPRRLELARAYLESVRRDDEILASCLTIGELFAGAGVLPDGPGEATLRAKVGEMRLVLLPFAQEAIDIFAELRSVQKVKAPDAMNLACAGAAGVDLFLTYDKALLRLQVPGIKFISSPGAGLI